MNLSSQVRLYILTCFYSHDVHIISFFLFNHRSLLDLNFGALCMHVGAESTYV